ncbi:MAG TPA: (E)-4-hydroxy-3-methylbut-2-enyl-diphosphate synthase [Verrucomicrobiota bacterium]|nr:(E)-4-hydroxy-3-methylbut-2-enyl-diphosphate synthase [Verrucomicrobiota bacterium]
MSFSQSLYFYQRRPTREVVVGIPGEGGVIIGADQPVVVQSMLTSKTADTESCVREILELEQAGCQLVRLTAPTLKDAQNLGVIVERLRSRGSKVPLVADIHFIPEAAIEAARWVEKIRINPGNYADSANWDMQASTPEMYEAALKRVEEKFLPLLEICKKLGRAMRIGSNHGSLSQRIMSRYGDTPLGMVEAALEYARIARKHGFHNFLFSMKASSPKVTIAAYRLLAQKLSQEGPDCNYPFHLGVTEAGQGADGRIKSAVGIGALLVDGLGETIRVSLSEDSVHEIPVCRSLLSSMPEIFSGEPAPELPPAWNPYSYERRPSEEILYGGIPLGGMQPVRVLVTPEQREGADRNLLAQKRAYCEADYLPQNCVEIEVSESLPEIAPGKPVTIADGSSVPVVFAFRWLAAALKEVGLKNPILLKDTFKPEESDRPGKLILKSSVLLGSLLCDGIGDCVLVRREKNPTEAVMLAWNILQASGSRTFKTEYISCPSCGRTLFDIQKVIARISERTGHLSSLKIGIMGCIVNGPGEMADADFGYVGGAPGKITLYVGKTPVKRNIPEEEAVDALVELIKEHGRWEEPPVS